MEKSIYELFKKELEENDKLVAKEKNKSRKQLAKEFDDFVKNNKCKIKDN